MAIFYLQMGLEITCISEFIQFHPESCFENLDLQIAEDRMMEVEIQKHKSLP